MMDLSKIGNIWKRGPTLPQELSSLQLTDEHGSKKEETLGRPTEALEETERKETPYNS